MGLGTTDRRKAALDLRLHDLRLPDHPDSKVNRAVAEIERIWRETAADRSAQLVFCDLSTPTGGQAFSVYEDMREKLIVRGLPASDIEFIQNHDGEAAKLQLFRDVRAGKVRILFGSTREMGTGANVQERLIALHHLDAPWRPADVKQREGRILRQGKTNAGVQIYRYVTEASFDAFMWQCLETKANFTGQLMTGESDLRRIEDVDGAALAYGDIHAILRPIQRGIQRFTGWDVLAPNIVYAPVRVSAEERQAWLNNWAERLRAVESERPVEVGEY